MSVEKNDSYLLDLVKDEIIRCDGAISAIAKVDELYNDEHYATKVEIYEDLMSKIYAIVCSNDKV